MKVFCGMAIVGLIVAFTAVNLFLPYAVLVLAAGIGLARIVGIPCGFLTRDPKRECRLGYC
jgi:hypothetical protein